MSDLISRQAAIDAMAELQGRASTKAELKGISKAWKRIKQLPSAQPEHKKGKWIDRGKDKVLRWQCPECGRKDIHIYNFCPDCGLDMREDA